MCIRDSLFPLLSVSQSNSFGVPASDRSKCPGLVDCGVVLVFFRFPGCGCSGFVTPPRRGPAVCLGSADLGQVSCPLALRAFERVLVFLTIYGFVSCFSTGVAGDRLVHVVGFDLECTRGAGCGLHAVLLFLMCVCRFSDLLHVWIVNFHPLLLCLLVDCTGDD